MIPEPTDTATLRARCKVEATRWIGAGASTLYGVHAPLDLPKAFALLDELDTARTTITRLSAQLEQAENERDAALAEIARIQHIGLDAWRFQNDSRAVRRAMADPAAEWIEVGDADDLLAICHPTPELGTIPPQGRPEGSDERCTCVKGRIGLCAACMDGLRRGDTPGGEA